MAATPVIYLVGTQCRSEYEDEFNRWYDEVHIPLLLKFKGLKEVTRFRLIRNKGEDYPKYLTLYRFDNQEDLEAYLTSFERANALSEMQETWKIGEWRVKWQIYYEVMKSWQR